jgi:uncharacterized membrane protein YhaH (DUF805 family)
MYMLTRGRINRATYWVLLIAVIALFTVVIAVMQKRMPYGEIALIVLCVPRLHDIGWSGWWAGGVIIAEIAVVAGALASLPEDSALVVMGLFVFAVGILLIVLGLIPGQVGTNRFGAAPAPGVSFGRTVESPENQF